MEDVDLVFKRIDKDQQGHIEKIQEFIRQPTISNTGEGMEEGAEYLQNTFTGLGCQISEVHWREGANRVEAAYYTGRTQAVLGSGS